MQVTYITRLYILSDGQTEYQINDRRSFVRFFGFEIFDSVLDAKTIWKLKNDLSQTEAMEQLFCLFDKMLETEGHITYKETLHDSQRCADLLEPADKTVYTFKRENLR